ncbi:hypothetical protein [Sporichthya sp.]|uniref:anti-sigma factor family protein n=1 Tax=Sporichthya sp. TaxID=65475 RepID=UPI00184E2EE3|nr:hypothetical protein [Sporichthya sp.]MBA3741678.1 hypothetical protein [Sporichthya sp.]
MTTHEHLSIEILADYAEGLLGDADATSVSEILASCADCQAEADLLVSVGQLLAADDPGPMPAHFAARIDATLADLAAAEPVTPKSTQATTVGGGATVIDLASRRRFTPAARVTSVAASLVLLIGGVALGMQAIGTDGSSDPGLGATGILPTPSSDSAASADRAALYAQTEEPTGKDRKKGKNGAIIDKRTGTVFVNNKVLFSDGTVVVKKKNGDAEVRTFSRGGPITTIVPRSAVKPTPVPTTATTPVVTPESIPQPTPTPTPKPPATTVKPSEPYVKNSGDVYSQENFAAKVQGLLRASGDVQPVFSESSESTKPSPTDQNRVSSGAVRSDEAGVPARGPAPADVAAKVKRCADQLGYTGVLAGDVGTWKGQAATILVTRNAANAKQADGYVVFGDCTKEAPATKASIQWEQRVDLPDAAEEPTPAPSSIPAPNDTLPGAVTNSTVASTEQ